MKHSDWAWRKRKGSSDTVPVPVVLWVLVVGMGVVIFCLLRWRQSGDTESVERFALKVKGWKWKMIDWVLRLACAAKADIRDQVCVKSKRRSLNSESANEKRLLVSMWMNTSSCTCIMRRLKEYLLVHLGYNTHHSLPYDRSPQDTASRLVASRPLASRKILSLLTVFAFSRSRSHFVGHWTTGRSDRCESGEAWWSSL